MYNIFNFTCGGIPVFVDISEHFVHTDAQYISRMLHDSNVGLVQQQPVDVGGLQARAVYRLKHNAWHLIVSS